MEWCTRALPRLGVGREGGDEGRGHLLGRFGCLGEGCSGAGEGVRSVLRRCEAPRFVAAPVEVQEGQHMPKKADPNCGLGGVGAPWVTQEGWAPDRD